MQYVKTYILKRIIDQLFIVRATTYCQTMIQLIWSDMIQRDNKVTIVSSVSANTCPAEKAKFWESARSATAAMLESNLALGHLAKLSNFL